MSTTRTRRATLAVVMMTKNEAHRLAACLDRVAGWADEIVIIDDLSTDRTAEIAEGYGAKVFAMASEDDHFRQWNRGIDRATAEWILHIDADEWVTPALQRAVDQALDSGQEHAAYELMRLNYFLGHPMRHGGWRHRHKILFRRGRARCVGKGIHSQLQVEGTTGFIDADIEHYPFATIEQFLSRQNHYTSVDAAIMREEQGPARPRTIWYQAGVRPPKLFWKFWMKLEGRRDGWVGLVFAMLFAFCHFLLWAKYWEASQAKES